jgi:hypothetical protein
MGDYKYTDLRARLDGVLLSSVPSSPLAFFEDVEASEVGETRGDLAAWGEVGEDITLAAMLVAKEGNFVKVGETGGEDVDFKAGGTVVVEGDKLSATVEDIDKDAETGVGLAEGVCLGDGGVVGIESSWAGAGVCLGMLD